jgi:hypothetical protein
MSVSRDKTYSLLPFETKYVFRIIKLNVSRGKIKMKRAVPNPGLQGPPGDTLSRVYINPTNIA